MIEKTQTKQQQNKPYKQFKPKNNTLKAYGGALAVVVVIATFTTGYIIGSGDVSVEWNGSSTPGLSRNQDFPEEGLDELYTALVDNYDGNITYTEALDGLKSGLVDAAGDPYTEYLSAEEKSAFEDSLNGSFEGIGAELSKEGNYVTVVAPIKGTPAYRAGVQPKDAILEIDGESAADISVSEAVQRIRGPKGEEVKLKLLRDGEQVEVSIVRDTITIESVEWENQDGIGVISVGRFGTDTSTLMSRAASELKSQGARGIILDLRGNPGGLLDSAVDMSSLWLKEGSDVLLEKRGEEVIKSYQSRGGGSLEDIDTVVLIDGGSASASEIVAGALHDNGAAQLVGQTSYGKGSVQRLIDLSDGGSLKVTIARWYTPKDKNIDKEGISPDVEVENDKDSGVDEQMQKALELLR